MPQVPPTVTVRATPEASGVEVRVSRTRHGTTVWKSSGGEEMTTGVACPEPARAGSSLTPADSLAPSPFASKERIAWLRKVWCSVDEGTAAWMVTVADSPGSRAPFH